MAEIWLALVIGNSRLHWAQFAGDSLQKTWDEPHLVETKDIDKHFSFSIPDSLWIASVVPAQTQLWANYPQARILTLDDVPLRGMYATLGIDRALAVWGAIATVGSPVLVIDAGTALTFTGADAVHQLVGGAILPGLRLQVEALGRQTAALPMIDSSQQASALPERWALDTEGAIASGILHTLLAGIQSFVTDWRQRFPESSIVITGGDGPILFTGLQQQAPAIAASITVDPHLIFHGIRAVKYRTY